MFGCFLSGEELLERSNDTSGFDWDEFEDNLDRICIGLGSGYEYIPESEDYIALVGLPIEKMGFDETRGDFEERVKKDITFGKDVVSRNCT